QVQGLRARIVYDRDTADRLGITTSAIDQTLYDAYGQRQVSTMFTQLNQYHVVLEVKPEFQQNPNDLSKLFIRTGMGSGVTSGGIVAGGSSSTAISTGPSNAAATSTASSLNPGGGSVKASQASGAVFGVIASPASAVFPTGGQV